MLKFAFDNSDTEAQAKLKNSLVNDLTGNFSIVLNKIDKNWRISIKIFT